MYAGDAGITGYCAFLHTMRSQNLFGPLIAALVGAASGYYIFEPIVRQSIEQAKVDKMRRDGENLKKDESQ